MNQPMNDHFEKADSLLRQVSGELQGLLEGDPLECYNPQILDEMIAQMIQARGLMSVGRHVDDQEGGE